MPRFVPNGPVVPDRLVQELEDDRVVIFCGAGISMGSGLPSYGELVSHCYNELGQPLPSSKAQDWLWPDRMLGSLESQFSSNSVRRIAVERLTQPPTNLELHQAILRLARLRKSGGFRLVTTNFDLLFEQAKEDMRLGYDFHSGPILPIPRNDKSSSWRSIVYLHGRLRPEDEDNSHLVLTSADFGRAYLTDAWAARFVMRLFSDFTVLFVGYSLNDPVLRYMTDAFAAEDAVTLAGNARGPAYIFVPYRGKLPDPQAYQDRKLEPIFYHDMRRHLRLKKTLMAWADAREDYLSNVRIIIGRVARTPPTALNPSDTNNLLWAVLGREGDEGHGAKVFAALDPSPSLEWLQEFERRESELLSAHKKASEAALSNGQQPPGAPVLHVGSLFPPRDGIHNTLGPVSTALAKWIVKHLSSLDLVDFVIDKLRGGRRLHALLRMEIQKASFKAALPEGFSRFWKIVSSDGAWAAASSDRYYWNLLSSIEREVDTPWVKQEILAAFSPRIAFLYSPRKIAFERNADAEAPSLGDNLGDIAGMEVRLDGEDNFRTIVDLVNANADPDAFWASILGALTSSLRGTLELFEILDQADVNSDPTIYRRPSIVPHPQNQSNDAWPQLFDLLWRGWQHLDVHDGIASRNQIAAWKLIPYLGFRRLVIAAIHRSAHTTIEEKLQVLIDG